MQREKLKAEHSTQMERNKNDMARQKAKVEERKKRMKDRRTEGRKSDGMIKK
jgi:hypothetical protein